MSKALVGSFYSFNDLVFAIRRPTAPSSRQACTARALMPALLPSLRAVQLQLVLAAAACAIAPSPGRRLSVACTPAESFVAIDFEHATLVRSNLGGQGGRCVTAGLCDEMPSTPHANHEIYIRNVGALAGGDTLDIRITNETEYRAWRATINGVKRCPRRRTF